MLVYPRCVNDIPKCSTIFMLENRNSYLYYLNVFLEKMNVKCDILTSVSFMMEEVGCIVGGAHARAENFSLVSTS